jgi:hypothetical protein
MPNLFEAREADRQTQIPGAERIGQGELAQRKANAQLEPKVEQKPMDEGLFSDEAAQKKLFQPARASDLIEVPRALS